MQCHNALLAAYIVLTPNDTHSHTIFWGVFRYRSGERLHGMQEVTDSIPLFSTQKALYFVGSTVLFFLHLRMLTMQSVWPYRRSNPR